MTNASVNIEAGDIAKAIHHCDHDHRVGPEASYLVTHEPFIVYIQGTPAALFAAAARLNKLAAEQVEKSFK